MSIREIMASIIFRILIIILAVLLKTFIAKRMEYIAKLKGYDKTARVFWIVFFFNLFGIIYTIALPDLNKRKILEKIASAGQNNSSYSFSKAEKYDDLPKI